MNFFKILLATILGFFISLGVFSILFFTAISVMMSSVGASKGEGITVEDNTVLELDFQEPLTGFSEQVYFEDFNYTSESFNGLNSVLQIIEIAKTDPHIKGISPKSAGNLSEIAFAQELCRALEDFKASGKFVLVYNDEISRLDYYLQSVADKVYIGQLGNVNLQGLSSEILFYKDLQEKARLRVEVIRHGKYKSAVEPFLKNRMSDNNRLQTTELLNVMWSVLVTDITKSRNLSVEKLNEIAMNVDGRMAELAQQDGLIDGALFRDEFEKILCKKVGEKETDDVNFVSIENYAESVLKGKASKEKDKMAVIYANGEIMQGEGNQGIVGHETIIAALRKAVKDKEIKAIVLRINSPGGDALASELMHREIAFARKQKKVYVSMGSYAASGGYYIACNAEHIFAETGSITDSIGVFGALPNASVLAKNWGVNAETVSTHPNALQYSYFQRPLEHFVKEMTESVGQTYRVFLSRVAEGRGKTVTEIDSIAQGRVWSGKEAPAKGLIGELGSPDDAIAYAAKENGLENYHVVSHPHYKMDMKKLLLRYGLKLKNESLQ